MRQSLISTVSGGAGGRGGGVPHGGSAYRTRRELSQHNPVWYPATTIHSDGSSMMSSSAAPSFSDLSNVAKGYSRQDDDVGVEVVREAGGKRRCTSREAALAAAVLALLLLAAVLIALVAIFSDPCRHTGGAGCAKDDSSRSSAVKSGEIPCLSASCVGIASRVVSSMDREVAPCDDFYQYACGRYGEQEPLPVTSGVVDAYTVVSKVNQQRIRELLETPGYALRGMGSAAVLKAKTYFRSCMNVVNSDKVGKQSALQLIRDLGSWPLTSDEESGQFDAVNFDLEARLSRAFQLRSYPLVLMEVEPDLFGKKGEPNILQFGPGSLGLQSLVEMTKPESQYQHDVFVKFFTTVTTYLGADPQMAARTAEDVWKLNEAVARITPGNILTNLDRPTIAQFNAGLQRNLDVGRLIRLTFGSDMRETERVLVLGKDYFTYLNQVLAQADKGLLATYITWQTLVTMAPYLTAPIRQAEQTARAQLYGTNNDARPTPRWELCVQRTTGLFPSVVDAIFVDRHFPQLAKEEGEAMVGMILEELRSQLPLVSWIDNQTLEEAQNKLGAITHRVGYPQFTRDPDRLDHAWAHIGPLNVEDELYNLRMIRTTTFRKSFEDRNDVGNNLWWDKTATETLGTYDRFRNQLVFTAGVFQYPFYESEFPRAMKLGALGTMIGEETVHIVDKQGRYYDAEGSYRDWWSPRVTASYTNSTTCFSKRPLPPDAQVDMLDLSEKLVADSGALRLAYKVFSDFVTHRGGSELQHVLPAVNLTEPQLFFTSYAQRFCVKNHGLASIGGGGAENSNRVRVNMALQNSPEFSSVFQCSSGSSMNPKTKCSLW